MTEVSSQPQGPDLTRGIALLGLADGEMLVGHVGDESVLLVWRGADLLAVGATCNHYSGPLAEGLLVGDTVRCPWHHACFSLRTGAAMRTFGVEWSEALAGQQRDGMAFVGEELPAPKPPKLSAAGLPDSVVIIGGGAAGNMAAETLRQEGYAGPITLLSADASRP